MVVAGVEGVGGPMAAVGGRVGGDVGERVGIEL